MRIFFIPWVLFTSLLGHAHEIKYSVERESLRQTLNWVEKHFEKKETRTLFFLDTSGLALFARGRIIRIREMDDGVDLTVKLRPARKEDIRPEWRNHPGLSCESDRITGAVVSSCSLNLALGKKRWRRVRDGDAPLEEILPAEATAFLGAHETSSAQLRSLKLLGPIEAKIHDLKIEDSEVPMKVRFEAWELPSHTQFGEFSFRAPWGQIVRARQVFLNLLADSPVTLGAVGEAKTALALKELVENN